MSGRGVQVSRIDFMQRSLVRARYRGSVSVALAGIVFFGPLGRQATAQPKSTARPRLEQLGELDDTSLRHPA
jgi:hypothetical protein